MDILRRRDPKRRMARLYYTGLQLVFRFDDAPAPVDLVREWGRIGSPGTIAADRFGTEHEARLAGGRIERVKRRKGYG